MSTKTDSTLRVEMVYVDFAWPLPGVLSVGGAARKTASEKNRGEVLVPMFSLADV